MPEGVQQHPNEKGLVHIPIERGVWPRFQFILSGHHEEMDSICLTKQETETHGVLFCGRAGKSPPLACTGGTTIEYRSVNLSAEFADGRPFFLFIHDHQPELPRICICVCSLILACEQFNKKRIQLESNADLSYLFIRHLRRHIGVIGPAPRVYMHLWYVNLYSDNTTQLLHIVRGEPRQARNSGENALPPCRKFIIPEMRNRCTWSAGAITTIRMNMAGSKSMCSST